MSLAWTLRAADATDAPAIAAIYNHYVASTCVSFESEPVAGDAMASRIAGSVEAGLPWLVAGRDGVLAGYAYATKWRARDGYRFSVESSVYLDPARTGEGLGRLLYAALVDAVRACGMHTMIGGIALPNPASIALHERLGFRKVAHFAQVGFKQGRWVDVGYWQLQLGPEAEP